jgi:hypothetical protein
MRLTLWVLLPLLAVGAVIVPQASAICQINDPTRFACMDLENRYSDYVTVYWDGNNYGCNTAPGTTCSFIVPVGTRAFFARANDGVTTDFGKGMVTPGCCDAAHLLRVWEVRR